MNLELWDTNTEEILKLLSYVAVLDVTGKSGFRMGRRLSQ